MRSSFVCDGSPESECSWLFWTKQWRWRRVWGWLCVGGGLCKDCDMWNERVVFVVAFESVWSCLIESAFVVQE